MDVGSWYAEQMMACPQNDDVAFPAIRPVPSTDDDAWTLFPAGIKSTSPTGNKLTLPTRATIRPSPRAEQTDSVVQGKTCGSE